MNKPQFFYTTYIRSTPEKIWEAITNPEFSRQYWGNENISDWKKGSKWQHVNRSKEQEVVYVTGEVIESKPPQRLVLSWHNPQDLTDKSIVTFEIEKIEDMVRLDVTHSDFKAGSTMPEKIAIGWPRVLCSMKSFLETGKALNVWAGHEGDCAKSVNKKEAA